MGIDGHGGGRGGSGSRWLEIAERLLGARDLVGCKRFAERAMEAEPLLDGVDQVLAVADVLLAGQRRINNHVDWYAVLQLLPPSASSDGSDAADIRRQYRRLALLLHHDRNRSPGADAAFRLVADAFAVLSNPDKKSLFDAEIRIAAAAAAAAASKPSPSPSPVTAEPFWTKCPTCCNVHMFAGEYLNLSLRCSTCRQPFLATELSSPPHVVPGTDMYYCSWGFFPLGFPGGPCFYGGGGIAPSDLDSEWKPFYPMFPNWGNNTNPQPRHQQPGASMHPPDRQRDWQNTGKKENINEPQWAMPAMNKKTMAEKKVEVGLKKRSLGGRNSGKGTGSSGISISGPVARLGSGMKPINLEAVDVKEAEEEEEVVRGININEEYKSLDDVHEDSNDSLSFHIDVDATNDILGNLHNLPFLKEDDIPLRTP
ncbi:uncharacterized protein LOC135598776 [Musa acuminata AAA Group]|uniref:uncharacterized protein LOC135598776 n=1 Tax=Musa acuminata AAA Group TaxID=214697 RepID=UPI0031D6DC16